MNIDKEYDVSTTRGNLIGVLGWYGVAAILIAYALVSFSVLDQRSAWYQLLNLTGALGVGMVSWHKRAFQPLTVNIVWAAIALLALIKLIL